MKTGTLLVALVVAGACVAGIVWLAGGVDRVEISHHHQSADAGLEISETGPWPKVVVPETEHTFDVMAVGSEGSHTFVFKNKGDAPLRLKLGTTTCKCTLGELAQEEIPVGEEAEVELTWTPEAAEPEFMQTAEIHTNDPNRKLVTLTIQGRVEQVLNIRPEGGWQLQSVGQREKEKLSGEIFSLVLDEFEIESIETSDHVEADFTPMSEQELQAYGAKSGYKIAVTFDPQDLKMGKFAERVVVHTDVESARKIPFGVAGRFVGSIRLLPFVPKEVKSHDVSWRPDSMAINLGVFQASEGGEGWYTMLVGDMPEGREFEVQDIVSTSDSVTTTVTPQEARANSSRAAYLVTFQVKPGSPPGSYRQRDAVEVVLKTNHPYAPEIKFHVEYIAK